MTVGSRLTALPDRVTGAGLSGRAALLLLLFLVGLRFILGGPGSEWIGNHFLLQYREPFGAAVSVWWFGQNLMDLAPYVDDARSQSLLLLGGVTGRDAPGYHDWNNILAHLDLLQADHTIARVFYDGGRMLMVGALLWGGYLLLLQRRQMRQHQ